MSGRQGAINKIESGDVLGAIHDLVTSGEAALGVLSAKEPMLGSLVSRLLSDEGQVAKQVAQDAWTAWEGNTPLPQVAEDAAKEAATKGLTVAVTDVADWLGLIDRNTPTPAAPPVAAVPGSAS